MRESGRGGGGGCWRLNHCRNRDGMVVATVGRCCMRSGVKRLMRLDVVLG